jgi:hypothetical protein
MQLRPILLALSLSVCGNNALSAEHTDDERQSWFATLLPLGGDWKQSASSAGIVVYISSRNAIREGAVATAWVRWETIDPQVYSGYNFSYKSSAERIEFDCVRIVERTLAYVLYADNNLTGDSKQFVFDRAGAWSPDVPGSLGEQITSAVCNQAKPHTKKAS